MDDSRKLARRRLQRETIEEIDERVISLRDDVFGEPRGVK
jgi:hypothetical protein